MCVYSVAILSIHVPIYAYKKYTNMFKSNVNKR